METMTVDQVLEITMNMLKEIQIPASLVEQIGIPVCRAINNIQECLTAIHAPKPEPDEEEPKEEKKS